MYVVEGVGADGASTLFGPFRVEQSARDFAARLHVRACIVELIPPVLEAVFVGSTRYNERRPRSVQRAPNRGLDPNPL